jgi:hypothetical protein
VWRKIAACQHYHSDWFPLFVDEYLLTHATER